MRAAETATLELEGTRALHGQKVAFGVVINDPPANFTEQQSCKRKDAEPDDAVERACVGNFDIEVEVAGHPAQRNGCKDDVAHPRRTARRKSNEFHRSLLYLQHEGLLRVERSFLLNVLIIIHLNTLFCQACCVFKA